MLLAYIWLIRNNQQLPKIERRFFMIVMVYYDERLLSAKILMIIKNLRSFFSFLIAQDVKFYKALIAFDNRKAKNIFFRTFGLSDFPTIYLYKSKSIYPSSALCFARFT